MQRHQGLLFLWLLCDLYFQWPLCGLHCLLALLFLWAQWCPCYQLHLCLKQYQQPLLSLLGLQPLCAPHFLLHLFEMHCQQALLFPWFLCDLYCLWLLCSLHCLLGLLFLWTQ